LLSDYTFIKFSKLKYLTNYSLQFSKGEYFLTEGDQVLNRDIDPEERNL